MNQNEKQKLRAKGSVKLTLIVCALCVILCVCLFSATSYAWFTDSVTSNESSIITASYGMSFTVKNNGEEVAPQNVTATGAKTYDLSVGTTYDITFAASGTATTGFAMITVTTSSGSTTYYKQIDTNTSANITFTVSSENVEVELDYQWGKHGRTENVLDNTAELTI